MPCIAVVPTLVLLIGLAHAQQSPATGASGYTTQQHLLNATERQAVADVVDVRCRRWHVIDWLNIVTVRCAVRRKARSK